jgi:hypothetical protein
VPRLVEAPLQRVTITAISRSMMSLLSSPAFVVISGPFEARIGASMDLALQTTM